MCRKIGQHDSTPEVVVFFSIPPIRILDWTHLPRSVRFVWESDPCGIGKRHLPALAALIQQWKADLHELSDTLTAQYLSHGMSARLTSSF